MRGRDAGGRQGTFANAMRSLTRNAGGSDGEGHGRRRRGASAPHRVGPTGRTSCWVRGHRPGIGRRTCRTGPSTIAGHAGGGVRGGSTKRCQTWPGPVWRSASSRCLLGARRRGRSCGSRRSLSPRPPRVALVRSALVPFSGGAEPKSRWRFASDSDRTSRCVSRHSRS